jgi:hypothetical protein
MPIVTGVFKSGASIKTAIERLRSLGIPEDKINVLAPGSPPDEVESRVETSDTEQPGMGEALGGVVGAAIGAAGGMELGVVLASAFIPGVGPILAAGAIGAALLGSGGALAGAAAGDALEEPIEGVPHDEIFVYEDALRKGRAVVFVNSDEDIREEVKRILESSGAESVDAAREEWWLGLRDDERAFYETDGGNFDDAEPVYRRGFEAALHPGARGKSYDEDVARLHELYGPDCKLNHFKRGYERGCEYYRGIAGNK